MATLYQLAHAAAGCVRAAGGMGRLKWSRKYVAANGDLLPEPERLRRLYRALRVMVRQGRAVRGVVANEAQHAELAEIIERTRAHVQRLRSRATTAHSDRVEVAATAYEHAADKLQCVVDAADAVLRRAEVIREIMPPSLAPTVGIDVARGDSMSVLYVQCRCRRTSVVHLDLTGDDWRCECGMGCTFDVSDPGGMVVVRGLNEIPR